MKANKMANNEKKEGLSPSGEDHLMIGASRLPCDIVPQNVSKFSKRDANSEPFESDDDYFNAIVACQSARLLAHRLRSTIRSKVYSTQIDSFALPSSPFFSNGRDLNRKLEHLSRELDEKRETMVAAMKDPPLVEKFLDNMGASDTEKNIFRYVLVETTVILQLGNNDDYGVFQSSLASTLDIQAICAPDQSLAELLSLTVVRSPWVKEQIYNLCLEPSQPISGMSGAIIRAFSGSEITVEQYNSIESTTLQHTMLVHGPFMETETGKKVLTEQRPGDEDCAGDAFSEEQAPLQMDNKLAEALAAAETDGRLCDIIERVQQEEAIDAERMGTPDSEDSEQGQAKELSTAPYSSEMEYLEDQIRLMDLETKWKNLKTGLDTDGEGEETSPLHFSASNYMNYGGGPSRDDIKLEMTRDASRLESKLKKLKKKIATRLNATKKERAKTPRLEQLCDVLKLDQFEKFVILDLLRNVVNPFNSDRNNDDPYPSGVVATYIERFTQSLEEKMDHRKYFYKSSTIVKEGIVSVSNQDFKTDLNQALVQLDRRMFDYIIGLDTEFSELVDGSHLYTPDSVLDDVILPKEMKARICEAVLGFGEVKEAYRSLEIDKKITYGLGQVILFYGASGTGKTMMANALAAKLKRKILLVNFPSLGENSSGEIIKFLFREARIKRAVLFFDECESLFRSREQGNYSINTILSELEKLDDLCIMATNRPCDLDEAMYRRVSLAIQFMKPDHMLREKIWKTLRPPNLELEEDVDYRALARKFELTGGLIKNAWLRSVALRTNRHGEKVSNADLEKAASEQVVGRLSNEDFDHRIVPICGTKAVICSAQVGESLKDIVQHTKAQAVLFGQWGFGETHRTSPGISALFHGPPGVGKSMAAEAVGYDLGRPLMVVNTAELIDKYVGGTGKNLEAVFLEAKQREAVLVFDEAEGLFGTRLQGGDSVGRHDTINVGLLLQHIENFSGVCIVVTNQKGAIDEAFFRRFRYVLHFEQPTAKQRLELWKSIVPKACPLADDVSFELLAKRYEMCGGNIKSALLRAATRAALRLKEEDCVVTIADLEEACEEELSKNSGSTNNNGIYA